MQLIECVDFDARSEAEDLEGDAAVDGGGHDAGIPATGGREPQFAGGYMKHRSFLPAYCQYGRNEAAQACACLTRQPHRAICTAKLVFVLRCEFSL